jgi:hypothetical protein
VKVPPENETGNSKILAMIFKTEEKTHVVKSSIFHIC